MGGITFLDYVKELPKGKKEAKGSSKGGYSTGAPAAKAVPAANGGSAAPSNSVPATQPEALVGSPAAVAELRTVEGLAAKIVAKVGD